MRTAHAMAAVSDAWRLGHAALPAATLRDVGSSLAFQGVSVLLAINGHCLLSSACACSCAPCPAADCLNRAVSDRNTLKLGTDAAEVDSWGMDCYVRRNILDGVLLCQLAAVAGGELGPNCAAARNLC